VARWNRFFDVSVDYGYQPPIVDYLNFFISIPHVDRIPVAQIVYRKYLLAFVYTILRKGQPVKVCPVVFGVECRVYCCDNRRRLAGCVEDWKVIEVGNVKWQR